MTQENKRQKITLFSFWELHFITVLFFNLQTICLSKRMYGIFDFYFVSFLSKFTFFFHKNCGFLSFTPRPLIFKSHQKNLKLYDNCMSWCSPETDQQKSFLEYKNRCLRTSVVFNRNYLTKYFTFLYLLTCLSLYLIS